MLKKIKLLVILTQFICLIGYAADKKNTTLKVKPKYILSITDSLLGKSVEDAKKRFPFSLKETKCEEDLSKGCSGKFKSSCSCFKTYNEDPETTVRTSEIIILVNKNKIIEIDENHVMQEWHTSGDKSAGMLTKVFLISKDAAPKEVHRENSEGHDLRAIKNNMRYYFSKWKDSAGRETIGEIWCSESIKDGELKMDTKFRDCYVKQTISSALRVFDPFEGYKKVDVEY